jgi:aminocarboxymuconate-semialdehyde decarboxylase
MPDFAAMFGGCDWPGLRDVQQPDPSETYGYGHTASAMLTQGGKDFRPITKPCFDMSARLADLDKMGIDQQILSVTPILFQWQRNPAHALYISQVVNNYIINVCSKSNLRGRLRVLCQVPLQDVDASCREVERVCLQTDEVVGVQIGNHVGNKDLDDEGLITFLQHCAEKDVPVLVHPWDMDSLGGRLDKYMMKWTVGMPMETHLSIVAMILGGAFDRLPRSLRLCFAHGGGAFPYLLGRLDNAWQHRSIARGKSEHLPSSYCDRFSVDSAVFDAGALRLLTDVFGTNRIMLGSDYPFPLGEQRIGDLVANHTADFLDDAQRIRMLGANASSFFKLNDDGSHASGSASAPS